MPSCVSVFTVVFVGSSNDARVVCAARGRQRIFLTMWVAFVVATARTTRGICLLRDCKGGLDNMHQVFSLLFSLLLCGMSQLVLHFLGSMVYAAGSSTVHHRRQRTSSNKE
jgi:hypothetical protein